MSRSAHLPKMSLPKSHRIMKVRMEMLELSYVFICHTAEMKRTVVSVREDVVHWIGK